MGALAADLSWTAEDDLKLKNAVEGGLSLESLAKGLVQFSRRFTIQELQDRWRALLYDPIISAEASSRMLEFEQCASTPKSNHLDNNKENNTVSVKRKAESVRRRFYAMRKRMRDIPLNSLDPIFPDADFLVYEPVKDSEAALFPTFEVAGDAVIDVDVNGQTHGPGHQNGIGINDSVEPYSIGTMVSYTFQDNISLAGNSATGEEESDDFDEIYKLLEDEEMDLPAIADQTHIGTGGGQTLALPPADIGTATENPSSPPTLQQMPVWSPDEVSFGDATNVVTSADRYLIELSKTLFDLTTEEDLLPLMDADGNLIDKSYIDGLSSLLVISPRKDVTHDITVTAPPIDHEQVSNNGQDQCGHQEICNSENLLLPSAYGLSSLLLDSPLKDVTHDITVTAPPVDHEQVSINGQDQCGHQEICNSENLLLPSAYGTSPKTNNSTIICTLNTEDPEIPSNDDVFLLPLPPSLSHPFMMQRKVSESPPQWPSSPVRDSSINLEKDNGSPTKIGGISNTFEQAQSSPHLACGNSISPCEDQSQLPKEILFRSNNFPAAENRVNVTLEKNTGGSDSIINFPRMNAIVGNHEMYPAIIQQQEASHTGIGSTEATIPVSVKRHSPIDEEESSSLSDYDIPGCHEVEAMILDEDLVPDEHNLYLNGGIESSHHLPSIQKKIIRLEQAANAFVRRDMTSHGALAMLQGCRAKHYIKKPEVLIGRATEDVNVDIDLGGHGSYSKVSRRQAIIRLDEEGSFHIENLGKYPIFVNSVKLATDKSIRLASSCLIEIRENPFLFETNQTCIKQYVDEQQKLI